MLMWLICLLVIMLLGFAGMYTGMLKDSTKLFVSAFSSMIVIGLSLCVYMFLFIL